MHPKVPQYASKARIHAQIVMGAAFLLLAGSIYFLWPAYYHQFIASQLMMTPDSKTYQMWNNNPVPIHMDFYFFNWTNRHSLEADGEMHIPQFRELGPYHFREKLERVNVTWNDNGTVTYKQAKWWYFDPENSKGSLTDIVTSVNVIALTAANVVRDWNIMLRKGSSFALDRTGQNIHIQRSVGELLFDGYSDKLIDIASTLPAFANVKVPMDKFGWFYKRNGTTFMDGVFNMNTGTQNIHKMGKLENWNYSNQTTFFSGKCGQVMGTSGQLFPPGQTKEKKVEMFSPDLCRSVAFEFEKETEVQGVPGYKYLGGISMMDNGTLDPDTECFCNGECVPAGVTNLTACRFGAPAFASYPHFYLADSFFTDSVRGMRPDKEKHEFYLVLEPTTGVPLEVAARLQVNVLLQPTDGIGMYDNVPTVFFPILWFQQRVTLPSQLAGPLRLLLFLKHLGVFLGAVSALLGCVLIGYAIVLWGHLNTANKMELRKKKTDDACLYVAALDNKDNPNQYIIMKPTNILNL